MLVVGKQDVVKGVGHGLQCGLALLWAQLALPNHEAMPTHARQLALRLGIAFAVAVYLLLPKVGVGFGQTPMLTTLVAMPKAAVYEDASAVFAKNKVGMPR